MTKIKVSSLIQNLVVVTPKKKSVSKLVPYWIPFLPFLFLIKHMNSPFTIFFFYTAQKD